MKLTLKATGQLADDIVVDCRSVRRTSRGYPGCHTVILTTGSRLDVPDDQVTGFSDGVASIVADTGA